MRAKEQRITEDLEGEEEEERPLMIKRRKQMERKIFNLESQHPIPYQNHNNFNRRHKNLHQLQKLQFWNK
jgi:hypothetical protein